MGAANIFQSNRSDVLWDDCSWYLESRCVGNFRGKGVGDIWTKEGVGGRENVSDNVDSLYQIKSQLVRSLNLVHFECKRALPNMEDVL